MNKCITILSFSSRADGNCAKISEYVSHYYMQTNVRLYIIDSKNFASCSNCNYECLKQGMRCPHLTENQKTIMDAICNSDLVYFIVPNYCGYPCANYFAYNERSVGYFSLDRAKMNRYMDVPKRFIIVSNTEGFEKAMQQQTNSKPEILYLKSGKYKRQSIAGDLMDSETVRADLDTFLALDGF